MHQLEKEAQNDPFLMEALEGYEQSDADQQKNLVDLYARLHDRTHKTERRIIPWRLISIAASILIVLTIGGLWLRHQSPETTPAFVKISKPQQAPPLTKPSGIDTVEKVIHESAITKQIAKNKPHAISKIYRYVAPEVSENKAVSAPVLAAVKPAEVKKDTIGLGEVTVIGYGTQKKTSITGSVQSISQGYLTDSNTPPVNNELSGKVAGITITKEKGKPITGVVKDETNHPIPGATVSVKGTDKKAVTDVNGKFVLPDVSNNSTLNIAFIGYSLQQVAVNKRDSIVIAMQPNTNSLNEVVVVGYGTQKKQNDDDQQLYEGAHPVNGWGAFKKYLKDNAKSPDGKTGVVKVSFTINEYGALSDFKIKKSLGNETDNAAIQLIQNGPRWVTNTDHKPETVTVRVKFAKHK